MPLLGLPLGVLALAVAPVDDGPTLCPFALATGTACPGCGMTRALAHLVRGDAGAALDYHPLAPLILVLAFAGWGWGVLRSRGMVRRLPPAVGTGSILLTASLLLAVWLVRLVSGSLPPV